MRMFGFTCTPGVDNPQLLACKSAFFQLKSIKERKVLKKIVSTFNYYYACVHPWANTASMIVLVKFNICFSNILGLILYCLGYLHPPPRPLQIVFIGFICSKINSWVRLLIEMGCFCEIILIKKISRNLAPYFAQYCSQVVSNALVCYLDVCYFSTRKQTFWYH